jgi:hypothetical protein
MDKFQIVLARQVAQAAIDVFQQRTDRAPKLVTVVLGGVRLAVKPHRVLCSTRGALMAS